MVFDNPDVGRSDAGPSGPGSVPARGRTEPNRRRTPGFARRRGSGSRGAGSRVRSAPRPGFARRRGGRRARAGRRATRPARGRTLANERRTLGFARRRGPGPLGAGCSARAPGPLGAPTGRWRAARVPTPGPRAARGRTVGNPRQTPGFARRHGPMTRPYPGATRASGVERDTRPAVPSLRSGCARPRSRHQVFTRPSRSTAVTWSPRIRRSTGSRTAVHRRRTSG